MTLADTVARLMRKYPEHVPVIVVSSLRFTKTRFLCPGEVTVGGFMGQIRKYREDARAEAALFILTQDQVMPPATATMMQLYMQHATPEEPALTFHVCEERVFGDFENSPLEGHRRALRDRFEAVPFRRRGHPPCDPDGLGYQFAQLKPGDLDRHVPLVRLLGAP